MPVKIATYDNLTVAVAVLRGNLVGGPDIEAITNEIRDLLAQGNRRLVIDMADVRFINSRGLGTLIALRELYERAGGSMTLCAIDKGIDNILMITQLTTVFTIEENRTKALRNLQANATSLFNIS